MSTGKKALFILLSLSAVCLSGCFFQNGNIQDSDGTAAEGQQDEMRDTIDKEKNTEDYEQEMEEAMTTPFGAYPELVTYTLGKMTGTDNAGMPEGSTYEDNVYTQYLKEKLNVQNKDVFEADDGEYGTQVSLAIATGKLPDIMMVQDTETLAQLIKLDLIEDLTDGYENCASERIKDIYESYGDSIMETVTEEGKIMAVPETNLDDGADLLWLRRDWIRKLGLEEPETIEDAVEIIRQFMEQDPGGNGKGNTVGLVCDTDLVGNTGYCGEYQLNIIFAGFGAFPQKWIYNEDGELVYGSVQPEAKKALAYLRKLYKEGILDQDFLLRKTNNIISLITEGKCGSFFGPWWAPNNPLEKAVEQDPDADWQPYLLATDADGSTSYAAQKPTGNYIVVRKGYEHPEIVWKIISMIFDYERYQEEESVFSDYYQLNVDPTARPLAINVDYNDGVFRCYEAIRDVLSGNKTEDDIMSLERAYLSSCQRYIDGKGNESSQDWAAYTSRITACSLLNGSVLNKKEVVYTAVSGNLEQEWQKLQKLEKETYLKIITGEKTLASFDRFVKEWYRKGGEEILKEKRNE